MGLDPRLYLWILFSGTLVLSVLGLQKRLATSSWFLRVASITIGAAILALVAGFGDSLPGPLSLAPLPRLLSAVFLGYILLGATLLKREADASLLPETALTLLCQALLGVLFISADHLLIHLIVGPALILLAFAAPRLRSSEATTDAFATSPFWVLAFVMACVPAALSMVAESGFLQLGEVKTASARSLLTLAIPAGVLFFLGAGPTTLHLHDKSGRWSLIYLFKWSLVWIAALFWYRLFLQSPAKEALFTAISLLILGFGFAALRTRSLSVWLSWLTGPVVALALQGLVVGTLRGAVLGFLGLVLGILGLQALTRAWIMNQVPPASRLREASEAIRKTSTAQRAGIALCLALMTLGNATALEILGQPIQLGLPPDLVFFMRLVPGLLVLPLLVFAAQVLTPRLGFREPGRPGRMETLANYSGFAIVILLGLYPWPLYNYFVFIFGEFRIW